MQKPEVSALEAGMDFRKIEYRREVFLRFYEFHLRYRAHPGAVYYVIPSLAQRLSWSTEDGYWWAFLNGNTQHPVTSTVLFNRFRDVRTTEPSAVRAFLDAEWARLEFDADRRYWKTKLPESIARYQQALGGRPQSEFFEALMVGPSEAENFASAWDAVRSRFFGFGRLSAWSYLEYLSIIGLPITPGHLMLADRDGSKSHRNGLCKVLGRDDLDWHQSNPDFDGRYTEAHIDWLAQEARALMADARARSKGRDVSLFTLESTLCCYKSWHRPNRRYPNVYNDMFHDRIRRAERVWGVDAPVPMQWFWDARADALPKYLRLEDCPDDPGLSPAKQNHYRLTGEVIMMDRDWPCFANSFKASGLFAGGDDDDE